MDKRIIFQAAALASVLALVGVIVQAIAGASLPKDITAQPGFLMPPAQFLAASNGNPDTALTFFAADSLFVLSYVMVFVGLYRVTAERARTFAVVGLGAGILTALLDASENAVFIMLAQAAKTGNPVAPDSPQLPGLMIVLLFFTNLKWTAAFATLYAFGLVFPRRNGFEWLIVGLMLLFPLVGVLGVAIPSLILVRGLFFLVGMPLFALYFWRQSRAVVVN